MNASRIQRGYTLIELVVSVGLFALVMTLASGAYLLMIDLNRQTQGIATGINSLSFALETMTRGIRTGTEYNCGEFGGDCPSGSTRFSFLDSSGRQVIFDFDEQKAAIIKNDLIPLTDASLTITALTFYVTGTGTIAENDYLQPHVTGTIAENDYLQPHVTIVVSGTVSSGPRRSPQPFTIQTGATMRGIDLTVTRTQ